MCFHGRCPILRHEALLQGVGSRQEQASYRCCHVSGALRVSWSRRSQGRTGARKAGGGASMDLSSPDLPGLLLCWVGVITMPASGGAVGLQGMMCLRGWLGCEGGCLREQMRVSDQVATTSRVSEDALCTWSDPCACARPPGLSPDPGRGCALGTPPGSGRFCGSGEKRGSRGAGGPAGAPGISSHKLSKVKGNFVSDQIHHLPRPESSLAVDTATCLREQDMSPSSCSFLQL
jgi:hypothetical protein